MAAAQPPLVIDDARVRALLKRAQREMASPPGAMWREIRLFARHQSLSMFDKLRKGGKHRGESWADFKSPAARKNPASPGGRAGRDRKVIRGPRKGKPYIRTSGVGGSLMSGRDNLLQDTGTLRGAALQTWKVLGGRELQMQTNVKYAAAQQETRPFAFWIPSDAIKVGRIVARSIERELARVPGVRKT